MLCFALLCFALRCFALRCFEGEAMPMMQGPCYDYSYMQQAKPTTKTQRRRLTNQKPEPRPTSAPRTSRNSIAPSVQRLSDRRAPPVVSGDRCLALPLWSATAAYCCSVLLVACMTYCKPTFLDQWQSVAAAVPWLARVPLLLKLRSSVVSQQKCASNRRAVLSTK